MNAAAASDDEQNKQKTQTVASDNAIIIHDWYFKLYTYCTTTYVEAI